MAMMSDRLKAMPAVKVGDMKAGSDRAGTKAVMGISGTDRGAQPTAWMCDGAKCALFALTVKPNQSKINLVKNYLLS
ncbi:hypothetical protein GCM10027292_32610 [Hydrogenophaga aquatica]